MTPLGSKAKGSNWERKVSRELSLWLTGNESHDLLHRNTKGGSGDLRANHPTAWQFLERFSIECKCWKTADLVDWLLKGSEKSKIARALNQARQDAGEKQFLLIIKQNYREPFVFSKPEHCSLSPYRFHVLDNGRVMMFLLTEMLKTDPRLWY